jgi:hypothetical protein
LRRIEIAHQSERQIVGRIVLAVKLADVLDRGGLEVFV